ncbi:Putative dimethyl sulfoxide reductase catalytic subunit A [Frankliniella fusca]|nr:Putative dimethyl sulfoxide reductase catalytic subunit A [Frankliniella fusca]
MAFSTEHFIIEKDEEHSNEKQTIYRSNFKNRDDAKSWLTEYKKKTSTDWICGENYPCEKLEYHEFWKCQLSKKNKLSLSKRNLECKVEIHIKIKKVNKSTKRNDPKYLKRDIPLKGVIIIKGQHNHPIENHESLQYLRVTEETK